MALVTPGRVHIALYKRRMEHKQLSPQLAWRGVVPRCSVVVYAMYFYGRLILKLIIGFVLIRYAKHVHIW